MPIIRSADPADADGVAALWLQLNQTGELVDERYVLRHDADAIGHRMIADDWLSGGDTTVLVADEDGTLVGFVATKPLAVSTVRTNTSGSVVTDLFVAPSHRRTGVGRGLVEAVLDRERLANRDALEVGTLANDARAVAFWRALGFGDWRLTLHLSGARHRSGART